MILQQDYFFPGRLPRFISHIYHQIYSLALPPFPPFPGAAYGPSLLGNIMYRGGHLAQLPHGRATGHGMQRLSAGVGGMTRGFDNCK